MGPSRTMGAVIPVRRRAPTKVVVFQWPCGNPMRSLSPHGARPCRRPIFVDAPVSSMNTSLSGSRSTWPSNQACLRFRMSGRFCSSAWADFFERDPATLEEAPQPRRAGRHAPFGQSCLKFRQGRVRPGLQQAQDRLSVTFHVLRPAVSAQRTRTGGSLRLLPLTPANGAGCADPEPRRRLPTRRPRSDRTQHPLPQVHRQRLAHPSRPPYPVQRMNQKPPFLEIPNDSIRSGNALAWVSTKTREDQLRREGEHAAKA